MFGVSRARVTQHLNVLKLPATVVEFLADCRDPAVLRHFTERRLRVLTGMGFPEEIVPAFKEMLREASSG